MDHETVGKTIRRLRKERNLTQKALADALCVSDKAVSKWERGAGCPDVSLLGSLSRLLEVDLERMLNGDVRAASAVNGNLRRVSFSVCPVCHNVSVSTGAARISCCGRWLERLMAREPDEAHRLQIEPVEDERLVGAEHPMEKDHYLSFVALASGSELKLYKAYPEWDLALRIAGRSRGTLFWYCTQHGLFGASL